MKKTKLGLVASILIGSAGVAGASTISVSTFSVADYNTVVGGFGAAVIEDFEGFSEGNVGPLVSSVGTFTTVGGTGSGGTVNDADAGFPGVNDGSKLAIRDGDVYGRRSTTALLSGDRNDDMFLDSNDTYGISWAVSLGGSLFNRIALTLADATDVGATMKISTGTDVLSFSGLGDANVQIVVIDFGSAVSSATIDFENFKGGNYKINDGFSLDDIAVSAVPVPASLPLLAVGFGGLGLMARRKREEA